MFGLGGTKMGTDPLQTEADKLKVFTSFKLVDKTNPPLPGGKTVLTFKVGEEQISTIMESTPSGESYTIILKETEMQVDPSLSGDNT